MDMGDISRLAHHLRDNGEPILNAGAKLTLSSVLLHNLNEAFPMLVDTGNHNDPFQVISTNSSSLEIFHDLAFLHDFIQRTESLKVVSLPKMQAPDSIDISKFSILKSLEFNKIPVETITGLKHLSSQLDTIICTQCLGSLEEVLHCHVTENEISEWSKLHKAVFSYNGLESIDRFIHFVPWLQVLDLSHNHLTNANAIHCLPNLKCLNLGYNFLQSLPTFNAAASERLISLTVKFNHLETVEGLFGLNGLQELDLSCNCLADHRRCLSSLVGLSSLSTLWLCGNPLSFHKKHRIHTAQFLHINTIHREFSLDGLSLSKTERSVIGSRSADSQSYSMSVESSATHSQVADDTSLYQPQKYLPSRRSGRVRDAVISDYQEFEDNSEINECVLATSMETSTEHLETKKQIEILRKRFGEENWLHSQSGSCVQSILGLPQSPKPGVLSIIASLGDSKYTVNPVVENSLGTEPNPDILNDVCTPQKFSTGCGTSEDSQKTVVPFDQVFSSKESCPEEQESDISEDDEDATEAEEHVYTVQRDSIKLFLVITQFHIRERDINFGKTLEKWLVSSLLSCAQIGSDPASVQCTYDSIRRERQTRVYFMAEEDAQKIVQMLSKVLESRSLREMDQKVHRCLNCSSQFTRELNFWNVSKSASCTCPNCHSLLVVEMDEVPLPHKSLDIIEKQSFQPGRTPIANSPNLENSYALAQSPSKSSIGGAARSSVCNPDLKQTLAFIHSADDASATNNSATIAPARSAASLDHSPDWDTSPGETVVQRSDSDIEVISNPSQSSIEVIEDKGTPIRKRSEEPTVENTPAPPTVQAMVTLGLTESSSSDSFTESVCTTYENRSYSSLPKGNSTHRTDEKNDGIISEENEISDIIKSSTILNDALYLGNEDLVIQDHKGSVTTISNGSMDAINSNVSEDGLECVDNIEKIAERELESAVKYSYVDFTQVDHRLKLHLYLHVFKDEGEELMLLIRAQILQQLNTISFSGCVVFTNRNIYFFEVIGLEGDDPDKWLKKVISIPLKRLIGISGLPWNQGICLKFHSLDSSAASNSWLILLKDKHRTLNLVESLSGLPFPQGCEFTEYPCVSPANDLIEALKLSSQVCTLVSIFNHCKLISDLAVSNYKLGVVLFTKSDLIISQSSLLWMMPNSKEQIKILTVQKISNLITVEVTTTDCVIELHFLDETIDKDEVWCLTLETEDCLKDIISVLQPPWEEIFSVPLEIKVNSRSQISV